MAMTPQIAPPRTGPDRMQPATLVGGAMAEKSNGTCGGIDDRCVISETAESAQVELE